MSYKDIPLHLSHKPIVSVDYSEKDAYAGDAKFLSIGRATWNPEDLSAKILRWAENGGKWSRQSEEIPLWRVLDLAKLLIATITGKQSSLKEEIVKDEDIDFLKSYINDNMELYAPRIKEISELIYASCQTTSNSKTPNIFSYATSELSQDAILSWLIKWADDTYIHDDKELCMLGKALLSLLTGLEKEEIHTVDVGRQWYNIDVWVEINEDAFLIIEDKTGTTIHDDQLNRYRKIVEDEYKDKRQKLFYAYVKTGNEPTSIEKAIQTQGYNAINRQDLLSVLNIYKGRNPLVIDYRLHLQEIEDATNRYKYLPVDKWQWNEWQGFYKELENHINVDSWSYIANPAGGFLGLWWNFVKNDEIRMYLQFEEMKLCFKIEYNGDGNRSDVRWKYYSRLMKVSEDNGIRIEKPLRFGAGTYMTIGIVPAEDVFGIGIVNVDELIDKLKCYEQIVEQCISFEKD